MAEKTAIDKTPLPTATPALSLMGEMTAEQLIKLVTASVVAALQSQPSGNVIPDNLGSVIGDAVAAGMTKNQRRKVTIGEYIARLNEGRPEMRRRFFVNNIEMLPGDRRISNTEINLLNAINRTGRYINRLVEVILGADGPDEVVHFRFNNRKPDHQFALMSAGVRDFQTMLQMIVDVQTQENAAEDEDREQRGAPKRRAFGGGRNTREAEAAAGVGV